MADMSGIDWLKQMYIQLNHTIKLYWYCVYALQAWK